MRLLRKMNFFVIMLIFLTVLLLTVINSGEKDDLVITQAEAEIDSDVTSEDSKIYVDIKGAVKNPGMYEMDNGVRINDLINIAGGYDEANTLCLNLSEKLHDEQEVYVPYAQEECNDEAIINGIVNINKANTYELMQVNGIGETRAQAIVDYRDENGDFQVIEDIKNVSGIGDATFENIKDQITV